MDEAHQAAMLSQPATYKVPKRTGKEHKDIFSGMSAALGKVVVSKATTFSDVAGPSASATADTVALVLEVG